MPETQNARFSLRHPDRDGRPARRGNGHFRRILLHDGPVPSMQSGSLFTVPTGVRPLASPDIRIEVNRFFLGTVGIGEVNSTGHDTEVIEPSEATLLVPVAGRIASSTRQGAMLGAAAGEALFFSPNRRSTRVRPLPGQERFTAIAVLVPLTDLRDALERAGVRIRTRSALNDCALALQPRQSRAAVDLVSLVRSVHHRIADADSRLLAHDARRSWAERLTDTLAELLASDGIVDRPAAGDERSAGRHVRRALDYMAVHYADIETLTDVARACGVGSRTLETSFRTVWSQRPHQALTAIRLDAARRLLFQSGPEGSVTDIALSTGFRHFGRFSAAYRARFDELPSETLLHARP